MASTTTDGILMVYDDHAESVFATQQTCVRTLQALWTYMECLIAALSTIH